MQYDEKTFREHYGCAYLMISTVLLVVVMIGIICNAALYVSDITVPFTMAVIITLIPCLALVIGVPLAYIAYRDSAERCETQKIRFVNGVLTLKKQENHGFCAWDCTYIVRHISELCVTNRYIIVTGEAHVHQKQVHSEGNMAVKHKEYYTGTVKIPICFAEWDKLVAQLELEPKQD